MASIQGSVQDSAGHTISFAELQLLPSMRGARTNEEGRFRIDSVPLGVAVLRVRALGYRPREVSLAVTPSGWPGTIVLSALAVELPEVRTTARYAKPPEYAYTTKYDDFFRRRRLGFGRFITREDIESRSLTHFEQILYGIAGIRVSHGKASRGLGFFYSSIQMSRCADLNVALYVDGVKVSWRSARDPPDQALAEYLASVLPSRVEMVEVYHGIGQVPSDLDRTACAAIVIWTR